MESSQFNNKEYQQKSINYLHRYSIADLNTTKQNNKDPYVQIFVHLEAWMMSPICTFFKRVFLDGFLIFLSSI